MTALWEYRSLLAGLVARNVKVKYQRSVFGFLWTLLNPLVMATVLISVFSYVIRIPIENYWAFLISGFFVWNFCSTSLYAAAYTMPEHAHLTRSIAFPQEALLVGAAISKLIEFSTELLLITLILAIFLHGHVPPSFVLVPLLVLLQFLLVLGLQLPLATLAVFFKDVEHALPIALTALFYLSPVFYPAEMIPEAARSWYMLNPIAQLLTLYHDVLFRGEFPPFERLATMCLTVLALFAAGSWAFNRYKKHFAEVV
jgi:lipopolysaccharide transport system permease protein